MILEDIRGMIAAIDCRDREHLNIANILEKIAEELERRPERAPAEIHIQGNPPPETAAALAEMAKAAYRNLAEPASGVLGAVDRLQAREYADVRDEWRDFWMVRAALSGMSPSDESINQWAKAVGAALEKKIGPTNYPGEFAEHLVRAARELLGKGAA